MSTEVIALDVAGKALELDDVVAFCLAGTSAKMRLGIVRKISPKQVAIKRIGQERLVLRNHDAVSKVSRE